MGRKRIRRYSKYQRGGSVYTPIGTLTRQLSTYSRNNRKYAGKYRNQKGRSAKDVIKDILSIMI